MSSGDSAATRSVLSSSVAASTTAAEAGDSAVAAVPPGDAGEAPLPGLRMQIQESPRLRAIRTSPSKAGARSRQNSMQRGAGSRQNSLDRRAAAAGGTPVPPLKLGALGASAGDDIASTRQRRCALTAGMTDDALRAIHGNTLTSNRQSKCVWLVQRLLIWPRWAN